jgi:septal ring factor EnvC (AmiA/AmiB activator)
MQASAALAEQQLRAGRARLVEAREQLAAVTDGDDDRALAMEEAVRDTAERLATIGSEQAVLADVLALPLSTVPAAPSPATAAPYRLPVRGRLVTGMGEVSGNGVRARGLTLATAAAAPVVAPAAGRIRYAGPFRSFGRIVIIDHGAGWTTLLTGLGTVGARAGTSVAAGAPLGNAPAVEGARVTVELRRRGRPIDIAQLAG